MGSIETVALPSCDMKFWHPLNDPLMSIVETVCRGRGYWNPEYQNWIVIARFVDIDLSEIASQSRRIS